MTRSQPRLSLTMPLQIPTWWTPEQALAVFEMCSERLERDLDDLPF